MNIECTTDKGGAVTLNKEHGVWISYAVMTVADIPPAEILLSSIKLKDERTIQFFVNRETGLIVLDLIEKDEKAGMELFRKYF